MNVTKIAGFDFSWSPVTGCNGPDNEACTYCYAKSIAHRFGGYERDGSVTMENPYGGLAVLDAPFTTVSKYGRRAKAAFPFGFDLTLHRYRLAEPSRRKTPTTIFVCTMSDLFHDDVPDEWVAQVFAACRNAPQHRYVFLTKNPARYARLENEGKLLLGGGIWYGTTVTGGPGGQKPFDRQGEFNTWVSFEPLLGDVALGEWPAISWAVIGAMTGVGGKGHEPKKEWAGAIIGKCRDAGIPVLTKDSLLETMGAGNMLREFPWEALRLGAAMAVSTADAKIAVSA